MGFLPTIAGDRVGMDKATETLLKLRNDPVLFVEKVLKATPRSGKNRHYWASK